MNVKGNHHGNKADTDCGCTILIKDHGYPETYPFVGTAGPYENREILLIRNPFDALFTFVNFLWSGNDQKGTASKVSPDLLTGPEWKDHFQYVSKEWAEHAIHWIHNIRNGTVIFYELLLQDTEAELNRLLRAVNLTNPVAPERMRCTLKHKNRSDRKRSVKPR